MRKNSNFSEKTWGLNASQSKKNLFLIFSIALFLLVLPLISSAEFDNIKRYDEVTKTATIENAFGLPNYLGGYEIAKVKLDTPLKVEVGLGYQKVFEYTIDSYVDYNNFIQELEIYNLKAGNIKENKKIDLKYLTYETINVPIYETTCKELGEVVKGGNSTDCTTTQTGTEKQQQEKWVDIEKMDVKVEKLIISGWTEVRQGDYYEWIPKFAGVKVNEWATWSGNMSVGLRSYWKFDETSGTTVYDSMGLYNGTVTNAQVNQAGKLGKAISFDGNGDYVNLTNVRGFTGANSLSQSMWIYNKNSTTFQYVTELGQRTLNKMVAVVENSNAGNLSRFSGDYYTANTWLNTTWTQDQWVHLVYTYDGTNIRFYQNGVLVGAEARTLNLTDLGLMIGTYHSVGGAWFNGSIDEIGLWNRTLTATEVALLYNDGDGCAYGNESCYSLPTPTITLNAPVNAYNSSSSSVTFNATANSTSGITNVSLYLDGVLNETNTSGINATSYLFTKSLSDGNHNWSINSCNSAGCTTSATRTFTIDTTAPVLSDVALNTSIVYNVGDKVKLNFTATDTHLSTCWYEYNGANTTVAGCKTGVQNQTDITTVAGQTTIRVWANDTFGWNSTASSVSFAYDTTKPQFTLNSLANVSTVSLPVNASLNVTTTDVNLDDCWYFTSDSSTNITYTCNSVANVSFSTGGDKTITIWANDTVGNSNSTSYPVRIYDFNVTQTGSSALPEGTSATFTLVVNSTSFPIGDADAILWYDGVNKGVTTKTVTSANIITFTTTFIIPDGTGNSTGAYKNWNWEYNATQLTTRNTSTQTQRVYAIEIGDCATSGYGTVILNMTLKDEETNVVIPQANATVQNLEIDLQIFSLSNSSLSWTFNKTWTNASYGAVCIPNNILNNTNYSIDFIAEYGSTGYVNEFYFLDDGTLWNGCSFNSYTSCNISLMDLLSTDSTTFLFEFTDENGLKIDDAIIHTYRKYIGEGLFREVERSSQDETGQTHIHLVEEDVIYYFMISQYGEIIYTSSNYNAKCLSTPCTIELSAQSSFTPFPTNWSEFDGTNFSITSNKTTRQVSLNFLSDSIKTLNMTIFKYDSSGNVEYINSSNLTASAGTITLTVPNPYGNETFFVSTFIDGTFTRSQWVDFRETAREIFGTSGAILGGLMVLAVILMAVSEGVGFIIFTVLSVGLVAIMQLVDLTWMAVISIVVAGALIVWKLVARRNA